MAFDSIFQGPPSAVNAPGTAQSPTLGVDVVNKELYISSGNGWQELSVPSSGTVTSVGLTMPAEFAVSGSPVTSSGTLAVTKATQAANKVYAGPTTGAAAAPTFRTVVPADLPIATTGALGVVEPDGTTITISGGGVISSVSSGGTVTSVAMTVPADMTVTGSPITGAGTLAITENTQSANTIHAGPTTGAAATPTYRTLVPADLPVATTGAFGAVKPDGTTITDTAGVIAVPTATTGALGLVKPDGTTITVSSGVISATPGNFVNLGSVTLLGTSATMSVSSIPAGYRALKLVILAQVSGSTQESIQLNFNGDTGNNYNTASTLGGGGTFNTTTSAAANGMVGVASQVVTYPSDASISEVIIPAYASTTFNKVSYSTNVYRDNNNSGHLILRQDATTWTSTVAITSITLTAGGSTVFSIGSQLTLYGLS